jgi:hypothetical protein
MSVYTRIWKYENIKILICNYIYIKIFIYIDVCIYIGILLGEISWRILYTVHCAWFECIYTYMKILICNYIYKKIFIHKYIYMYVHRYLTGKSSMENSLYRTLHMIWVIRKSSYGWQERGYIYIIMSIHIYTYESICIYIHACIWTFIHIHMYIRVQVCIDKSLF